MKNENTILDNEKSQVNYNNDQSTRLDNEMTQQVEEKENRSVAATASASTGKVIATGLGGVLLGTAISQAANYFTQEGEEVIGEEYATETDSENVAQEVTDTPEWSTGSVSVATGVTDSMSFSEAFATARAEVGAGGAFEWNGNVYGTYYADEWNNMTAEEKADYNRQFNWGAIDTTNNEQIVNEIEATADTSIPEPEINDEFIAEESQETFEATEVETEAEVEIEVLGIINDAETGATAVPLIVDGEPVVLVDIDEDPEMDIMIADINHNVEIEENEILDISEYDISIDDIESCLEEDYNDSAVDYDLSMSDTIDYSDTMDI